MTTPLKTLFINHSVRDGGPGRSLFYILKYIDKTKITPFVLVPREDVFTELVKKEGLGDIIIVEKRFPENILRPRYNSNWLNQASWLEGQPSSPKPNNIPRHVISTVVQIISISLNVFDIFLLILKSPFLLKKWNIDVIYCNGTLAKIVGALIGSLNFRPVIWHVRNIQQTKALRFTMNVLSLLPAVKRIICVSTATTKQFRFKQNKISVVYNGVDIEEFNPKETPGILRLEYGIPEGVVTIGSTGRIVPRKGYENLINAALTVRKKFGEGEINKIRFVIVGDTPYFFQDNHLQNLKTLIKEYKLEDIFIFTGYQRDVKPYLKDFDIFVIPSSYEDPFPRVVIEAMAFSLPVIGFRVGGVVEAVEQGITGILSESGNTHQMGESILKLILDKSLRHSMGVAGRERAKRLYSAKIRTNDIENIIMELK
ncbi:MAG: glycosyltransferase family 4 protein [Thermodesulfobacteriota bacterium]